MNQKIKLLAAGKGVRLWQIAAELGKTASQFSIMLREELSPDKEAQIIQIIEQLSTGQEG